MRTALGVRFGLSAILAITATGVSMPVAQAADPTPLPSLTPAPTVEIATPSPSPSAATASQTPVADVLGGGRLGQFTGVVVDLSGGAKDLPQVKARTWVLADATTGAVLAAKKPHTLRRPASTLKTLTALTLLPKLDPDATWVGTSKAANTYGSKAGIRPGREYTIEELFYGLLLPSGNDAAIALAQANSSVPKTVAEMNDVAESLQAYNTTARNTSGLDAKGQFSTAYDLALIARAALAREDFRTYVGSKSADFPNPRKKRKKPITVYNQNDLVMKNYDGAIGVKTGYTTKAGRTFIGAAERDGTTLVVTLMGIKEPSADAARKLLNWGFKNRDRIVPVGELVEPLEEETVQAEAALPALTPPPEPSSALTPVSSQAVLAAPQEQTLSTLSPTAWGWLAVFVAAMALIAGAIIRRFRNRRRRLLT